MEWPKQIPSHWRLEPFKWQLARNDGGVWGQEPDGKSDTIVLRSTEQTVDGRWQLENPAQRLLGEQERISTLLVENDLVMTKSSGSSLHIGKTTLVTAEIAAMNCCYSNFMQRLRVKDEFFHAQLAWRILNSDFARQQFDVLSNSTTGLANLNAGIIGQITVPVAPISEQLAIAGFLDREIAKIDALVTEQQRLIDLLKEKRQLVTSHAVTKGLDPTAPLKDSGIGWLGKVPAHWNITKLKHATELIVDCPHETPIYSEDGSFLVVRTADLEQGTLEPAGMYRVSDAEYHSRIRRQSLLEADIVYGREGERWGHAALIPRSNAFCLGQRMMQFRASKGMFDPEFLMWQLNAKNVYVQGALDTVGATSPHVNVGTIRNYFLTAPPLKEQRSIARHLATWGGAFDTLITEAQRAIDLLQERRSALISAAVTGQIDVRATTPSAPILDPKKPSRPERKRSTPEKSP